MPLLARATPVGYSRTAPGSINPRQRPIIAPRLCPLPQLELKLLLLPPLALLVLAGGFARGGLGHHRSGVPGARLRLVARLRAFPNVNMRHVFCKQDGQRYTYSGASTAWKRGTQRAGIPNTQFRDLRAKALTDVDERSGIIAAQRMGAHSTQAQTADYIRNKKAIKSTATR